MTRTEVLLAMARARLRADLQRLADEQMELDGKRAQALRRFARTRAELLDSVDPPAAGHGHVEAV